MEILSTHEWNGAGDTVQTMETRFILARNIRGLMQRHPELDNTRKLAAKCSSSERKVGHNTIDRLLSPEKNDVQPRLDTIVAVARVFKVRPEQLLSAAFDPEHPHDQPPAEVIALARRIWAKRDALLDVLGSDAVSDEEMEALGWRRSGATTEPSVTTALHQEPAGYKKSPKQAKMRFE